MRAKPPVTRVSCDTPVVMPMPRLEPLAPENIPDFDELFPATARNGREVPNLLLTLARKPDILRALMHLRRTVLAPGTVSSELKNLVSQVASMSAGCRYCAAHTSRFGSEMGVDERRLDEIWNFERSALFTEAEKAALRVAQAAVQVPNLVSDEDFAELNSYFSEVQIIEILSVIGVFGFYNRVNDTLATELESSSIEAAQRHLAKQGWTIGKHAPSTDRASTKP